MRQARWYRGIRRPRVTYPCERRTDRMSYPRNQEPGERDAAGIDTLPRIPQKTIIFEFAGADDFFQLFDDRFGAFTFFQNDKQLN